MKCVVRGSQGQTERITGSQIVRQTDNGEGRGSSQSYWVVILHYREEEDKTLHLFIRITIISSTCVTLIMLSGDLYNKFQAAFGRQLESLSCFYTYQTLRLINSLPCWTAWNAPISRLGRPTHEDLLAFLVLNNFSDCTIWVKCVLLAPAPANQSLLVPCV